MPGGFYESASQSGGCPGREGSNSDILFCFGVFVFCVCVLFCFFV